MDGKATWQTAFSASIFNDVISVSVCGYSSSKVCATMRGAEKREGRSRKRRRGGGYHHFIRTAGLLLQLQKGLPKTQ